MQDHDRAVLLGTTTFGKGLVQSVSEVSPTSKLKFTTARYYLPSGRLIQKKDYFSDNKVLAACYDTTDADTLFYTTAGRLVKSGRGVEPDMEIESPFNPWVVTELWRQRSFSSFVSDNWASLKEIQLDDKDLLVKFTAYIDSSEFEFKPRGSKLLEELTTLLDEEELSGQAVTALEDLTREMTGSLNQQITQHSPEILRRLHLELARQQGGSQARSRVQLIDDETYHAALELLQKQDDSYSKLLTTGDVDQRSSR